MIAVIIVYTTGVIHKVVIGAAVVFLLGYAAVVIVPVFGVVASEFGAAGVVCSVVIVVVAAGDAMSIVASAVVVVDAAWIICDIGVLVAVAVMQ